MQNWEGAYVGDRKSQLEAFFHVTLPGITAAPKPTETSARGNYYIDFLQDGRRLRKAAGATAAEAQAAAAKQELLTTAHKAAVAAGITLPESETNGGRSLREAVTDYLDETKAGKSRKTYAAYELTLRYFLESCSKPTVEQIERKDLPKFSAFLRDEKDQAPRSVANKFENVMSFLKWANAPLMHAEKHLRVSKNDWPRYVEKKVKVYEKTELDTLFAACDAEERLWYEFFLGTGMREREVMHCGWEDVNLSRGVVAVTVKPEYLFTPKNYEEREIPIPDTLVASLKAWQTKADKSCGLVFPTAGCRPKLDFLDCLKAVVERAGLNPGDFILHRFRATFCTWHLRSGTDLRTVQNWMGHKDIESTMRYLKPNEGAGVRDKVNAAFV
jgi:integrase/recombinase XerD